MNFTINQSESIQLSGQLIGSTVSIDYTSMLYEQPANNNCFLSIWQDEQIPFGKAGGTTKTILGNGRYGSQTFEQLTSDIPYIVGWGAGNTAGTNSQNYGSIGASISFTPGEELDINGVAINGVLKQSSITPVVVEPNSIVVTFITLDGNNPNTNGNWIGLWQGSYIDYAGGYLQKWSVTSTNSQDSQGLNTTVQIATNSTYTLAYASGPNPSDIVARVTFKTAAY